MCHAEIPGWDGMIHAPKGVMLETEEQIAHEPAISTCRQDAAMPCHLRVQPNSASNWQAVSGQLLVNWYRKCQPLNAGGS